MVPLGSRTKGLLWLALVAAAAAAAVPALPWAARHAPWSVERALAGLIGGAPSSAACDAPSDPASTRALAKLVQRLYPLDAADAQLPISITVLHGKAVNAYAALGGHIYVFDGLIAQARSPEELAGVLAHEIEHVRNRHILQGIAVNLLALGAVGGATGADPSAGSRLAYLLLTMKFSRQQEEEADAQGLQRLARAQVDAAGFRAFFERAQKMPEPPPILSSHPASAQRAELAAHATGYPSRPVLDAVEWQALRGICR
jgi:predicted Zn-dependent protease